jgi:hypothetical protein
MRQVSDNSGGFGRASSTAASRGCHGIGVNDKICVSSHARGGAASAAAARNALPPQPAIHDRRYHDAGGATFRPILDPDSAILDQRDSFARNFSRKWRFPYVLTARRIPTLQTQLPGSLDRI